MNIYTQVGLITLVELITKHWILMCEIAKEEHLHNDLSKINAIKLATTVRLHPILMTTAAIIVGLIFLLFAVGKVARFNIGLFIVSSLAIGTAFTMFSIPVIYTYLA